MNAVIFVAGLRCHDNTIFHIEQCDDIFIERKKKEECLNAAKVRVN